LGLRDSLIDCITLVMNAQFAAVAELEEEEEEEEDVVGMSITGQSTSTVIIIIISIPLSSWTDRQDSRSIDLSPLHKTTTTTISL